MFQEDFANTIIPSTLPISTLPNENHHRIVYTSITQPNLQYRKLPSHSIFFFMSWGVEICAYHQIKLQCKI